jgi:peroxiredoxin
MQLAAGLMMLVSLSLQALAGEIPERPEDVRPLLIGTQIPGDVELLTVAGAKTTLVEAMHDRPAVLVFFRGGWCPYCDLQLSELRLIEKDLQALGYQVIAISPDPPRALQARGEKNSLEYLLLSDSSTNLIQAVGIAFKASAAVARMQSNLGASAAKPSQLLTVPAVYIVDARGKIKFHYVNPDYRVRTPQELLLVAARVSLDGAK